MKTVLEILRKYQPFSVDVHDHSEYVVSFDDAIEAMEEYAESVKPKWISVIDQHPPVNKPVLVFMRGRVTQKPIIIVDEYIDKEWRKTAPGFITHWMELPDAQVII